jgi:hypothetical protein
MAKDSTTKANSASREITIQGIIFACPEPYKEEHICTAEEANVLNQSFSEGVRNNFSKDIKKAAKDNGGKPLSEDQVKELQAAFANYASTYKFQGRAGFRRVLDPVTKEARSLARQAIEARMREKNYDKKDLEKGQMDKWIDQLIERDPKYNDEAKRRVEAIRGASQEVLADVLV